MQSENADHEIEIGRPYDHTARLVLVAFLLLLHMSSSHAGKTLGPEIHEIESTAPQ